MLRNRNRTSWACRVLTAATAMVCLAAVPAARAAVVDSLFNPRDYDAANLNALTISGDVTINTDAGTITGNGWTAAADSYKQETSENGNVELGVFRFTSVTISSGAITVEGNRGLVLASQGNFNFSGGTIDISGQNGNTLNGVSGAILGGLGGSGAEGGARTSSFISAPPGDDHGLGGGTAAGVATPYREGTGYGGAYHGTAGPGGGYGGVGGASGLGGTPGIAYGETDSSLVTLYGGSGGAAGLSISAGQSNRSLGSGGGGGGAIELIASGTLTFGGTILADGGDGGDAPQTSYSRAGGGGSGGGVILAANSLVFSGGAVNVSGGDGGDAAGSSTNNNGVAGGGGSGGRVAFYYGELTGSLTPDVTGGAGGFAAYTTDGGATHPNSGFAGSAGLAYDAGAGSLPEGFAAIPEPATVAFLAIGGLGMAVAGLRRRRRD